jgi:hypothetical protein
MGTVTALPTRIERGAHNTGPAFCAQCDHEWVAVAPVGTVALECPECHTMKGLLKWPCEPEHGIWTCACGCYVMIISATTNILCYNCGTAQVGTGVGDQ